MKPRRRQKPSRHSLREAQQLIGEVPGLTLIDCSTTGGSHVRIIARAADGTEKCFTHSNTSSDRRANLNMRALLRRFAREHTTTAGGDDPCPTK